VSGGLWDGGFASCGGGLLGMSLGTGRGVANMSSTDSSSRKGCENGVPSLVWLVGVRGSAGSLAVPVLSSSSSMAKRESWVRESRWRRRSERVRSSKEMDSCRGCSATMGMVTGDWVAPIGRPTGVRDQG
jgi:hypothetical protein